MHPVERHIRERAYFIWEGEGRVFGRAEDHWLRAESEFRAAPALAGEALAPSPAKVLKPKAGRAAGASKTALAAQAEGMTARAKAAAPKSVAPKSAASKEATPKSAAPKEASAPKKAATAKLASAKLTSAKLTSAKLARPRIEVASSAALH